MTKLYLSLVACFILSFAQDAASAAPAPPLPSTCPAPVVNVIDSSVNFQKAIDYALSMELMTSGSGYSTPSALNCTNASLYAVPGSCPENSLNLQLGNAPFFTTLLPPPNPTNQFIPFIAPLVSYACNYSAMAERWNQANPNIPIVLQGPVNETNPQGFYFSFGTQKRDPMLEVYHPFYNATRNAALRPVSKAYATAVALALQDQGKLDINAPAYLYVPALNQTGMQNITLQMVMTHTSGFINPAPDVITNLSEPSISLQESADVLIANGVAYPPGTAAVYTEYAFQILGAAVEAVTGESWDANWKKLIAEPLKMNSTAFWSDAGAYNPAAPLNPNITNPAVATSSVGSSADVAKFTSMMGRRGLAEDGTRVLSEDAIKQFTNWTGNFPLSSVDNLTTGFSSPCVDGKRVTTYNITAPPNNYQFNTVNLTTSEAYASQGVVRLASYGLGLWVIYDEKCRKRIVAQGLYNNFFEIFDFDGEDPLESVFGAAVTYDAAIEWSGRAVLVPAEEAVLGADAFVFNESPVNQQNETAMPATASPLPVPAPAPASDGIRNTFLSAAAATWAVLAAAFAV